jgi:hypothetical protein
MKLKRFTDFINEFHYGSTAYNGPAHTGVNHGAGLDSEQNFGHPHSLLPEPRRDFVYYSWDDFVNTDFKVYQDLEPSEEADEYGIYKLLIGEEEYVLKPCIVYEKGVTNVHLVDLKDGDVYATISEEIPESRELKKGEFYINPNIPEYESIIDQLIEQGFMTKKEESNQIVGEESSDVYKVLGL